MEQDQKTLLVSGGAGFIGSAFVRLALNQGYRVVVVDKLTYAGRLANISEFVDGHACRFIKGDIGDFDLCRRMLETHHIHALVNFAAESHVDNSILGPRPFFETNVMGTLALLEAVRDYWATLAEKARSHFRFLHVSTDEVFGELPAAGTFSEKSPYAPSSPYSASKAASDHLVRAWYKTYGLPTIVTHCSNNYGPRQHPEKLIPLMITCALAGQPLPVYGRGDNVRDWIHVEDHVQGVLRALEKGKVGASYCFGGNAERTNLEVVNSICDILDELSPHGVAGYYRNFIRFVPDRLGHDFRYAIDDTLARSELGFERAFSDFEKGLRQTITWYLEHWDWVEAVGGAV